MVRTRILSVIVVSVTLVTPVAASTAEGPAAIRPAASPATAAAPPQDYVIGPDDVLHVFYWRDQDLSAEAVVRPDGRISLPLLRDVPAMGLSPDALSERIQTLASAYLEHPSVTVVVKQINSRKVFITGKISKPGSYALSGPTTVLQLIATAGGLTPFARQSRIVIMRTAPAGPVTLRFDYKKVSRMQGLDANVLLMPGDTVIVP